MPRDGFAFTVGVGRENYLVGLSRYFIQFVYHVLFFLHDLVAWHKSAFNINGVFVALRQIANVSDRSAHGKTRTQIFLDCLGFSR